MLKQIIWKNLTTTERQKVLQRPAAPTTASLQQTQLIIDRVRNEGDAAIRQFSQQFDKVDLNTFQVTAEEFKAAEYKIDDVAKNALMLAAKNIETFHSAQYPKNISIETTPGVVCEMQYRAIQRIGLYVPGGTATLPSTLLMLGIPAKIAGCPLRVLCSPPRKDGSIDPHILLAAKFCGIDNVFKMGGAQAIAAMAYGTDTVPKVDKIFGPGNRWVTQAKILVAQDVTGANYEMPAGPSEQMVIADADANAEFVAADLLSQAEHGSDSQVILICNDQQFAHAVNQCITRQISQLPRKAIIEQALISSSTIIVDNLTTAIDIANVYAPEHLLLQVKNPRQLIEKIHCAGSVFLGAWSTESVGDYASGSNHVLPTYGYARSFSGVSVHDFMKRITFQELSQQGLENIAPAVITLARIEGLEAHARAVTVRINNEDLILCKQETAIGFQN